jgi:hypothetical protein
VIGTTVLAEAIALWGEKSQIDIAIEELAELIAELMRHRRSRSIPGGVHGELADASIVLEQLLLIFGKEKVDEFRRAKLERLQKRIDAAKGDKREPLL